MQVTAEAIGTVLEALSSRNGSATSASKPNPFKIGKAYLIRSVTTYTLGRVKDIVGDFLVVEDGGWLADTGRFSTALATGSVNEFEKANCNIIVALGGIVDAYEWQLELPKETK